MPDCAQFNVGPLFSTVLDNVGGADPGVKSNKGRRRLARTIQHRNSAVAERRPGGKISHRKTVDARSANKDVRIGGRELSDRKRFEVSEIEATLAIVGRYNLNRSRTVTKSEFEQRTSLLLLALDGRACGIL
jgi:hypothetical protein